MRCSHYKPDLDLCPVFVLAEEAVKARRGQQQGADIRRLQKFHHSFHQLRSES
jgi:hypothetical protein